MPSHNRRAPREGKEKHTRAASEKRKPSGSPLDSLPPKTPKQFVQSTLDMPSVFTFGTSSPKDSTHTRQIPPLSERHDSDNSNSHMSKASSPLRENQHDIPYPSTLFDFINDASIDILTTKLSRALMLPQLQEKFAETFASVAKGIITDIMKDVVAPLKQEIKELRSELEEKTDELEQYCRRNSIRISGVPGSTNKNTEDVVLDVLKDVHQHISLPDIDRYHRVGRKTPGKRRQITVKFVTYWDKKSDSKQENSKTHETICVLE